MPPRAAPTWVGGHGYGWRSERASCCVGLAAGSRRDASGRAARCFLGQIRRASSSFRRRPAKRRKLLSLAALCPRYNGSVLAQAPIEELLPLAACSQLSENSRLGFAPVASTSRWAFGFAISSSTLGLLASLYDGRGASRTSGKERDAESGNDYFGARYYSSTMGRFMSPDWSAKAEPVPYDWSRYNRNGSGAQWAKGHIQYTHSAGW